MSQNFLPINGPIRVVAVTNVPGQYLAVDRLGRFLAQGTERALVQMSEAWNESHAPREEPEQELPVQVTACPECGYPKESEDQEKCLDCQAPKAVARLDDPAGTKISEQQTVQDEWL